MSHENTTNEHHSSHTCHGLILPLAGEELWAKWFREIVYFLAMLYFFLGTAIVTQVFMSSIDHITSHTKKVYLANYRSKKNGSSDSLARVLKEDEPEVIEVRVWNDTVANLILMAFGTASPEILLSIVEVVAHNFNAGKLGPATIVGSAAFNLLIITSVCMLALPPNATKRVHRLKVFAVTGFFSIFAYIWLLVILRYSSPNVVDLWEASVTFILFPVLIIFAYATDRNYFGFLRSSDTKRQIELDSVTGGQETIASGKKALFRGQSEADRQNLFSFVREAKKFPNLKDEEIALLAATKLLDDTSHSSNWHRINSVRSFMGHRKGKPVLNAKLKQIYEILKSHPNGLKLEDIPKDLDTEKSQYSVIEFHSPSISVKENIGTFYVSVCRYGNLQNEVKVRIESLDGTAKQGEDYLPVKEIVIFRPNESEKKVAVNIVDDNVWEPDEEFFLRMTIIGKRTENVRLGQFPIMEITIIDDDEPGVIMFEKRGFVVKESSGSVCIPLVRIRGADGDVSVKWKTVDKTAISGRDYIGGEGEITFKHNETRQSLNITIIDDLSPEKDEYFEVVLYDPTNGTKIGNINRVLITISNDDDFNSVAHRLMVLTGANLDALKVHTETWAEQFRQAMSVSGGEMCDVNRWHYILHFFAFHWKVLFAFIPPAGIFSGWLCFFVSLCVIGIMTTIIGDLATIFGCLIGMDDTITAITIVALGTTLPDLLGAQMVTRGEEHADGALIHISGSIAVNVLIGVGIPWFVACLYHFNRETQFIVESTGLEFSVMLFVIAAVIAGFLLAARRRMRVFGLAELGGPKNSRYFTVGILISLWLLYLLFSLLNINGVKVPFII